MEDITDKVRHLLDALDVEYLYGISPTTKRIADELRQRTGTIYHVYPNGDESVKKAEIVSDRV